MCVCVFVSVCMPPPSLPPSLPPPSLSLSSRPHLSQTQAHVQCRIMIQKHTIVEIGVLRNNCGCSRRLFRGGCCFCTLCVLIFTSCATVASLVAAFRGIAVSAATPAASTRHDSVLLCFVCFFQRPTRRACSKFSVCLPAGLPVRLCLVST